MTALPPPPLVFEGRHWSSDEVASLAAGWRDALGAHRPDQAPRHAMVLANHPRSVALFVALSSLPAPLVLLPPDLASWTTAPALPADTRVVLLDEQRALAGEARALGLDAAILPATAPPAPDGVTGFMRAPGVVLFTSGSTGLPRPVYRSTAAMIAVARGLVAALGLAPGRGVVTSLPLARAFGLNHGLLAAAVLRAPLAILDRFEHRAMLRLFATGAYQYWPGAPMMADVLGRCPLTGPAVMPPLCLMGGRVAAEVAERFRARFGVPLRLGYGTTETGTIAVDGAPPGEVRTETAGRPIEGVAIRIGDPRVPQPPGASGRIWLRAPAYMMDGYGFGPALAAPETVDGWWGTPDFGRLGEDGRLVVAGRLDDTWRTSAGHLVNPAAITAALDGLPGVSDAAVVPIVTAAGQGLGVLVQTAAPLAVADLRRHLAAALPAWSQPRVIECTDALPRLAGGKIDRAACIARLERRPSVAP